MGEFGRQFWREEEGQGLVEYALLIGGVVVLVIAVASIIGGASGELVDEIAEYITDNGATLGP